MGAALGGCISSEEPEETDVFELVASVRQVMQAITIPASNGIFRIGSEVPVDDEAWAAVENFALALAESGNLLLMPGRVLPEEQWRGESLALVRAAREAADAARAQDVDGVLNAGDAIYMTCEGCHELYLPR